MDVKKAIEEYVTARCQIAKAFKCESLWYNIIFETEEKWTDHGDEHDTISYTYEEDDDEEREFEYSLEVYGSSKWETEEYVMYCGGNGCGDRDLYVFKKSNYIKDA